jgi:2-hydroxyethylphosphonate dioxygenase
VPSNHVEIDPVKLMRWLNVRKLTVSAFGTAVDIDPSRLDADLRSSVLVWDTDFAHRASSVLDIDIDQLAVKPGLRAAVYRSAAESVAQRQTVRRDGIDFYNYYTLAGPHGQVAPVVLDILCPPDRLPALNRGHLEPAITVNLGPGDINGRWGEDLTPDTWSVLSANSGRDSWICGDSYVEPSFCPHTYSLTGPEPARILSFTGTSPLAGIVERTDAWPAESFAALHEDLGDELAPAAILRQAMRRRAYDVKSLCAAAGVDAPAVEDFLRGERHALDLAALRRIGTTIRYDYRLLLAAEVARDSVGKTSFTIEESRASIRSHAGYTVADMAGSPATPDLLGQFLLVDRTETDDVVDLRDPPATLYLVTEGSATARWRGPGGELSHQDLGRWDSLWIGPNVAHGFSGRAGLLRMSDASAFPYTDILELSNTYHPAQTLGRARQDRQGWGYDG